MAWTSSRANGMMKDGAIITKGEWQFARTMPNRYSPRLIKHQIPEFRKEFCLLFEILFIFAPRIEW